MTRRVKVAIVQQALPPSVVVDDIDLFAEPHLPHERRLSLSHLKRTFRELGPFQAQLRQDYSEWCSQRIGTVLDSLLASGSPPDVICFAECGVPGECLPGIFSRVQGTATTVIAGTHTPTTLLRRTYEQIQAAVDLDLDAPAVLPILRPDGRTDLVRKNRESIFETTDHSSAKPPVVKPHISKILTSSGEISVALLVCADALALPSYELRPDLAVITAMERNPSRFRSHIAMLNDNRVPVALVNDGRFGGSGIFLVRDRRAHSWWFDPPHYGLLPTGDHVLQIEIDVDNATPTVGNATPSAQYQLQRLVSILHEGSTELIADERASSAVFAHDTATLRTIVHEATQSNDDPGLLRVRYGRLLDLIDLGKLKEHERDVYINPVVDSLAHLTDIASRATEALVAKLDELLVSPEVLNDQDTALLLLQARAHWKSRLRPSNTDSVAGQAPTRLSAGRVLIDREEERAEIRLFVSPESPRSQRILVVAGLEACGKSSVIEDGLVQAGVRVARIHCPPGVGADFVFAALHTAVGRVAPVDVGREYFSSTDIRACVERADVLYISGMENLCAGRGPLNETIGRLFAALGRAVDESYNTRLILEGRQVFDIEPPRGHRPRRYVIHGLEAGHGQALLEKLLRERSQDVSSFHPEQLQSVVQSVDGHPGVLELCADAIARYGIERTIRDIGSRSGFFRDIASRLVGGIGFAPSEIQLLHAVCELRRPVPEEVLVGAVGERSSAEAAAAVLDALSGYGVVSISTERMVSSSSLVRSAVATIHYEDVGLARAIHVRLMKYFAARARASIGVESQYDALEANYHAVNAGESPPFDDGTAIDAIIGTAVRYYRNRDYSKAAAVLEGAVEWSPMNVPSILRKRTEAVEMLAESLAWTAQYDKASRLAEWLVSVSARFGQIYIELGKAALHERDYAWVDKFVSFAIERAADVGDIALLRGRLAERRDRKFGTAVAFYRRAIEERVRNPWVYFYLARALLTLDQTADAIDVIDSVGLAERSSRALDNALTSLRINALLSAGEFDRAEELANAFRSIEEARPEVVLTVALVRARADANAGRPGALQHLERAYATLDRTTTENAASRAQLHLYKGKVLEWMGDHSGAADEYRRACDGDPFNKHMMMSYRRALKRLQASDAEGRVVESQIADLEKRAQDLTE